MNIHYFISQLIPTNTDAIFIIFKAILANALVRTFCVLTHFVFGTTLLISAFVNVWKRYWPQTKRSFQYFFIHCKSSLLSSAFSGENVIKILVPPVKHIPLPHILKWLVQSWTLSWTVTSPKETRPLSPVLSQTLRGQRGRRERLGTRLMWTGPVWLTCRNSDLILIFGWKWSPTS